MNERIRKLVEQAALATNEDPNGEYPAHMMQKFAELIVRECFEVVINDGRFNDCKGIIRSAEAVAKEHFGVES